MSSKHAHDGALRRLRAHAMSLPEAHTKSPWPGHLDAAVRGKTFAHMSVEGAPLSMTCKLPESNAAALMLPFAEPAGYGLGKSGWVTARFTENDRPPEDLLRAWIDESYRAIAPKRLVRILDGEPETESKSRAKPSPRSKGTAGAAAKRAKKPTP